MTPDQEKAIAVAMDGLREAGLADEALKAMLHGPLLLSALRIARRTMQNEYYDKPRIGLELQCAAVDEVLALVSPAEKPTGASTPQPQPETCSICHRPLGPNHACHPNQPLPVNELHDSDNFDFDR